MTTISLKKYTRPMPIPALAGLLAAFLLWLFIAHLQNGNAAIGTIDPSILQVIMLGMGAWLVILAIALSIIGWLLSKVISQLEDLFEPLKKLTSWQQHLLYLVLFAVLVLSGTGCLIAIC
ncbi:hypothetical protein [Pedobacter insulae]|uniref:hypothetical protein n=1 Tax=Pedobacter insulae TaxID=414048 RepID=UPI001160478C|nr:hypothetical protein [Pedobacter insulae]